jgi:hypothetical protein
MQPCIVAFAKETRQQGPPLGNGAFPVTALIRRTRLEPKKPAGERRKTDLTLTGLLMEGLAAIGKDTGSLFSLSGDGQRPISECVPRGGLAYWYSDLLHEDEEGSRPKRSAMNLAG